MLTENRATNAVSERKLFQVVSFLVKKKKKKNGNALNNVL